MGRMPAASFHGLKRRSASALSGMRSPRFSSPMAAHGPAGAAMVRVASKATPCGWKIRARRSALRAANGRAVARWAKVPSGGRDGPYSVEAGLTAARSSGLGGLLDQSPGDHLQRQRLVGAFED